MMSMGSRLQAEFMAKTKSVIIFINIYFCPNSHKLLKMCVLYIKNKTKNSNI